MIRVIKPGIQTTVQDNGRIGFYEIGMPPAGAFDSYSYQIANMLVGNDYNAAALEAVYMGPTLEFEKKGLIAITGGVFPCKINGQDVPMWETIPVNSGDILSFGMLQNGARVYIAISGGIDVPVVMGSRSTFMSSKIGGYEGRPLKEGDYLKIGILNTRSMKEGTKMGKEFIPTYSNRYSVRFMDGLCSYRMTERSKKNFVEADWIITPDANRVGYRIQGSQPLEWVERIQPFGAGNNPSNVVDVGYPVGSIQVPDVSEPIILFKDAVTCGGYATIGTIISVDVNIMAQAKTGDTINFRYVSMDESLQARADYQRTLQRIEEHLLHSAQY